ncbi:MAG: Ni/Fe hydrogenase subunit alpha [Candidatus Brockarchaeota archaeon]|nr:Ni/Fe hydrogenase subunit alpha [Candidatus Brockarchaeota archaeon]
MNNISKQISRVVGHCKLEVDVSEGSVKDVRFNINEDSRFFEAFMLGRRYDDVPEIVTRICGTCNANHRITSIVALENAMGVKASEQTELLRKLVINGSLIQSHMLHLYLLVLPDYIGADDLFGSGKTEYVRRLLNLKRCGNRMVEVLCGRPIQLIDAVVGGFNVTPSIRKIEELLRILKETREDAVESFHLFSDLKLPEIESPEKNHISLKNGSEYALTGRTISLNGEEEFEAGKYKAKIAETVVPYSTSKRCRINGRSFYVGARARIRINRDFLADESKSLVSSFESALDNPMGNIPAKAAEVLHCYDDSIQILEGLASKGVKEERPKFEIKSGEGVGVTESTRGTLIHHYVLDDKGFVKYANIITPTTFNCQHIEDTLRSNVKKFLGSSDMVFQLERIIRAYDPCISCASHFLDLTVRRR